MVYDFGFCNGSFGKNISLCLEIFFFIKDFYGGNKREVAILF